MWRCRIDCSKFSYHVHCLSRIVISNVVQSSAVWLFLRAPRFSMTQSISNPLTPRLSTVWFWCTENLHGGAVRRADALFYNALTICKSNRLTCSGIFNYTANDISNLSKIPWAAKQRVVFVDYEYSLFRLVRRAWCAQSAVRYTKKWPREILSRASRPQDFKWPFFFRGFLSRHTKRNKTGGLLVA